MNVYKITMSVMMADSFTITVDARNEAEAYAKGDDYAHCNYQNVQEVREDECELLGEKGASLLPELTEVERLRALVGSLLPLAESRAEDLSETAEEDVHMEMVGTKADRERSASDAWQAIEDARSYLAYSRKG